MPIKSELFPKIVPQYFPLPITGNNYANASINLPRTGSKAAPYQWLSSS
jgi:hypothetical protein